MFIDLIFVIIVPLLVLFLLGQPIMLALTAVGLISIYTLLQPKFLTIVGSLWWNNTNSFALTAVPLFIFMGEILMRTGLTERLYSGLKPWIGRLPGGMLHTNIMASTVFSAVSGSSLAAVATIGRIAVPEMERLGYAGRMIVGSVGGGTTIGILIPPSIIMIIYGVLAQESIGQLFIAGIIPGLITAVLYVIYLGVRVKLQPHLAGEKPDRLPVYDRLVALLGIVPSLLLIFAVLGGIYLGIATPTEAAALGCGGALLLGLINRRLSYGVIRDSLLGAVQITSMAVGIFLGAVLISFVLGNLAIPRTIMAWIIALDLSPILVLGGIFLVYIILGMFFDGLSMMILTLPIVLPTIEAMGLSLIWFGVALVILIEIGMETPPVGMNLFVMHSIAPQYPFSEIIRGVVPFFLIDGLVLIIITLFPALVLWLPSTMIN